MASPEIKTVVEMLRANPLFGDGEPLAMRATMAAATDIAPPPPNASVAPVDAGGVPAEWTDADGVRQDAVLIYFHGGGYVAGSLNSHRNLVANLSRAANLRGLSINYRLAPENPYPAAVEDGIRAYDFVRGQGIAADRIVIAGDSAGGGLTAATLLALRDRGESMPPAAVLISPWLDLTQTSETIDSKQDADPMISRHLLNQCSAAYLAGQDAKTPGASPLFADLRGLPPLLVQVGDAECLLDDARSFETAAKRAGVSVDLEVWEEMIHVWHAFAGLLPEAQEAIDRIGQFLKEHIR